MKGLWATLKAPNTACSKARKSSHFCTASEDISSPHTLAFISGHPSVVIQHPQLAVCSWTLFSWRQKSVDSACTHDWIKAIDISRPPQIMPHRGALSFAPATQFLSQRAGLCLTEWSRLFCWPPSLQWQLLEKGKMFSRVKCPVLLNCLTSRQSLSRKVAFFTLPSRLSNWFYWLLTLIAWV